jgi:ABC-type glycerol-3-phosphate transport system substrate-binding protein
MSTRLIALLVGMVVLAACGSDTTSEPTSSPSAPTTTSTPSGGTPAPLSEVPFTTTVVPPDFTLFIAAVDAALDDTAYAGAALTDPEVFIATGQLFCELLDEGMSSDAILSEHLDALAAVNAGEVTDADATATGVVFGASTEVICPQHAG